jgi:2-polyprenyl-3-methyl-5-hydroxy-6-metoxy-1,4-benzoquinol methylase
MAACPNGCRGLGRWELFAEEKGFYILRCEDCGLGRTEPALSEKEIGKYYPPSWYGKNNVRFNRIFEWLVRIFRNRRSVVIKKRSKPGPVLDVGCGRGLILKNLESHGYVPFGVEISDHAAWHAIRNVGGQIHIGTLENCPFPEGTFEAVVFWHVLEHLPDPKGALLKAARLLKPGGLLVIAVPNSDSLQARIFGRHWFHLDIPRHYFHFGTDSLKEMTLESGFGIAQIDHFSLEQNPYGWIQSLYNLLGFRFNLLYDILKHSNQRYVLLRAHPIQSIGILGLLPLILPLSIALMLYETVTRQGGTVELYAVKH